MNLDLVVRTLAQIDLAQEAKEHNLPHLIDWNQSKWAHIDASSAFTTYEGDLIVDQITGLPLGVGSCSTAMCCAGWGLTLAGVKLRWTPAYPGGFECDFTADGEDIVGAACREFGIPNQPRPGYATIGEAESGADDHYDPLWGYMEEGMPTVFNPGNTYEYLVECFAEYGEMDAENLYALVEQEKARTPMFTIDAS